MWWLWAGLAVASPLVNEAPASGVPSVDAVTGDDEVDWLGPDPAVARRSQFADWERVRATHRASLATTGAMVGLVGVVFATPGMFGTHVDPGPGMVVGGALFGTWAVASVTSANTVARLRDRGIRSSAAPYGVVLVTGGAMVVGGAWTNSWPLPLLGLVGIVLAPAVQVVANTAVIARERGVGPVVVGVQPRQGGAELRLSARW